MKIYTKTGDDGTTGLLGNVRVRKDALRIDAYGTMDELNAALGLILAQLPEAAQAARQWLNAIQSDLFIIGTLLAASPSDPKRRADLPAARTHALEEQIDQMEADLAPLKNFILPQGALCACLAHQARAVSRRTERRVVALASEERVDREVLPYLNRLSDFLFVLARWINVHEGGLETTWTYSESGGAKIETEAARPKDRLGSTLKKLEADKENRKTLFEKTSSQLQKKKEIADKLFRQSVEKIKEDGGQVEKPIRDMDLD